MKSLIGYQWEIKSSDKHAVQLVEPTNKFILYVTKSGLACQVTGKASSPLSTANNWRYCHVIENGDELEFSLCTVQFRDQPNHVHEVLMVCPNKNEVFGRILEQGVSMTVSDAMKLLSKGSGDFEVMNHDGKYHSEN